MCDVEHDPSEALDEVLAPWLRARLSLGRPWTEEMLLQELSAEYPGLCAADATPLAADPDGPDWRGLARRALRAELEQEEPRFGPRSGTHAAPAPLRVRCSPYPQAPLVPIAGP